MIHCGFVALLGLPNAGKSTFLNEALGEKLCIVSSKPQATRQSFTGLISDKDHQLIFLDAPGFVESKSGLFDYLAKEFDRVIEKSEHLLLLISHEQKESSDFSKFINKIEESKKTFSLLFTKADLNESEYVKKLKDEWKEKLIGNYSTKNSNDYKIDEFLSRLAKSLPKEHHPLYDPDMISLDRTRDIVAEFIREECFINLEKEIPYGVGVIIKSFKKEKGLQHIQANIIVEKENHKAILIGKKGQMLKQIGQGARAKIQKLLGEKIFLGLHVAHKKNWTHNQSIMKEVGYHHDKS